MGVDARALWDFTDPAGSEERFRAAAEAAEPREAAVLMTQVARALGLQDRFDEGHGVLDRISVDDAEVVVRVVLERGRLFRSAGNAERARAEFDAAATEAEAAGLASLHVDALHMAMLAAGPDQQLALGQHALAVARASTDPEARAWEASLLHNLGMTHADAGRWPEALARFEDALARRREADDVDAVAVRVARWMVAWTLRNLGRTEEALAEQRALRAELDAAGEDDPYVDEEIALLTAATDAGTPDR